jgi:hypothetical protein
MVAMKQHCTTKETKQAEYTNIPLCGLAGQITYNSDHLALDELHNNRRLFGITDGRLVLRKLVEYIADLRQTQYAHEWCGNDPTVMDQAYDLTVSKFSNIPVENHSLKSNGPDCRYYFKAFCDYAKRMFEQNPPRSNIQAELEAAEMLRKFVKRHFRFSYLDCRRKAQKFVRRYVWKVNDNPLTVWLPVDMPGKKCRTWLESHVPDVDPTRPGERERVQEIIDKLLPRQRLVSLNGLDSVGDKIAGATAPLYSAVEEEISVKGLAGTVADEKAEHIEQQRPAIQALGRKKLRHMVHEIFGALSGEEYEAAAIAKEFGISTATFSRFAGNRWVNSSGNGNNITVPDLWRNTAHILANHELFAEAAQKAGVWKAVCKVVDKEKKPRAGDRLHFIPMLEQALKSPDPKSALADAFDQIKQSGTPEAYSQFEIFMDEAYRRCEEIGMDITEFICPVIQLLSNDRVVGELTFSQSLKTNSIGNIVPGRYQLKLNTGRIIWEGELTPEELIWSEAFPEQKLELAAETIDAEKTPTREIMVWDGEIIIRTYAGIESGSIEIKLTK